MFKLSVKIQDFSIVSQDKGKEKGQPFFVFDKATKTRNPTTRTHVRPGQVAGLLSVLLGERPLSTVRMSGVKSFWETDVSKIIDLMAAGAVFSTTEERVEQVFARKDKMVPNTAVGAIDSYHAFVARGDEFVKALARIMPGLPNISARVRDLPRLVASESEADRAVLKELLSNESSSGQRWCLSRGYTEGTNFMPRNYAHVEVNGGSTQVGSGGAPMTRYVRSGVLHVPVSEEHEALVRERLGIGASCTTFGEGGLAWVENPPTSEYDWEVWSDSGAA